MAFPKMLNCSFLQHVGDEVPHIFQLLIIHTMKLVLQLVFLTHKSVFIMTGSFTD